MKTKSKIGGYIIRSAVYAVLFSVALIALTSAFNSPNEWHKASGATDAYNVTAKIATLPERSASPSASRISERLKTFTGVTVFGPAVAGRILIASLRLMR